jgi:hypothetical protein
MCLVAVTLTPACDGADPATSEVLARDGVARDGAHVFQRDRIVSDDPAHFELLDGNPTRDSRAVYRSDGRMLSEDTDGFAIVSDTDHYLFTNDFECSADAASAYYRGADPATFPPDRAVTTCSETSVSFAQ